MAKNDLSGFAMASQLGFQTVISIGISIFIGVLLDGWLNTRPLFIIIFIFVGIATVMRNFYVFAKKLDRNK